MVRSMPKAVVRIAGIVRRAGLKDLHACAVGQDGAVNVHGEETAALADAVHDVCAQESVQGG